MHFSTLLVLAASALSVAVPTPDAPNPNEVSISGFTYAGSGCPAGSVASSQDPSKTVLTLLFDSYIASIGPGTVPKDWRKNCQVNLNIRYPGGYQFSIFSADYRGFEKLESGVTGKQTATYYFSGEQAQSSLSSYFNGPTSPPEGKDYLITDKFAVESRVWSPCGANLPLNINSQLSLSSKDKKASGLLTTDSQDFKFAQIYHIEWRRCKKN